MGIVELYGSAPRSGRGGRRFKSCHSDHDLAEIAIRSANRSANASRDEARTSCMLASTTQLE
jgi:hypothetical protein